ncbi:MAG: triose-phosphate isomerase [Candidatus Latescibacterota bacterium]
MRKKIIAGNWKMNLNHLEAENLVKGILLKIRDVKNVEIVVCPPFTSLCRVSEIVRNTQVRLGAQNMHWERKGAFTGEVSANMLLTLGCQYVILGHSERREYFHETDDIVALKIRATLGSGLTPIVCVGETRKQREEGSTERVVKSQVRGALEGLKPEEFAGTVVAYEPVWAIGTGLTATKEQAQDVHALIRMLLEELFGKKTAEETRIQYGGSMKASNARELLEQPDIDGGLIGGASLEADAFVDILRAAM